MGGGPSRQCGGGPRASTASPSMAWCCALVWPPVVEMGAAGADGENSWPVPRRDAAAVSGAAYGGGGAHDAAPGDVVVEP